MCECSVNVFVDSESAPPSGLAGSLALVPRAAIKMVARAYRGLPWDPLGPASPFRDPLDPQRDPLDSITAPFGTSTTPCPRASGCRAYHGSHGMLWNAMECHGIL